ncbi:competence type IV pilus assembly protein ComGB [Salipaludibacillus aurantiacus]|uniref:Competence protein ComGB n=1 Tax=Salipaludibacillus aurantiacus TaxID=1601833 RepID=A0A1H9R5S9_9BACI|nr:competence type IV pilus assembly protein ComGB [Salipaludibacillus aurantiacus]SER68082.1 competence protein ComGB [Salipaludibacillus aurantiacus]
MKRLFRHDGSRSDFLHQLASLLEEGYTLSEAVQMYMGFTEGHKKKWISEIFEELNAGNPFAEQLTGGDFPKELVSYLSFNEKYGDLKQSFRQASDILKKRYELKVKLRKIIHYPLFLLMGLIIMGSVMIEGVLPQFNQFFKAMGQDLPWITRMMLGFSQWLRLPVLLAVFAGALFFFLWFKRKPVFEQVNLLLRFPYINVYLRYLLTYYFTSQVAPLLKNGFSLYDTLQAVEKDSLLLFFQTDAAALKEGLKAGNDLSELLRERKHYLPQLVSVIALGESKGKLGEELDRFSVYLFQRMYESIYRIMSVFQPAFLCVTGFFILILFLSMMLPVFSILDAW